jgi:ubiquinone/menaquinone biosynthesis C-methylase UbiE
VERFDYDAGERAALYDQVRALPSDVIAQWLDELTALVPATGVTAILDSGCGTGRFAAPLAARFDARVYGLDPSAKMLALARRNSPTMLPLQAAAEAIPARSESFDLVFVSLALHHIGDRPAAFREWRRVLRPGGRLAIRTSTVETADSYLWLRFFPSAARIEQARTPSRQQIADLAAAARFELDALKTVPQVLAANPAEWRCRIASRGLSSLQALSDAEFAAGLAEVERYSRQLAAHEAVKEDLDLFVFRHE